MDEAKREFGCRLERSGNARSGVCERDNAQPRHDAPGARNSRWGSHWRFVPAGVRNKQLAEGMWKPLTRSS
jgi:hypothetical protein